MPNDVVNRRIIGSPNATLKRLLDEALIPMRNGVPTVISTATVDPITGANVPANTANGRTVNVGGVSFIGAALRADRATTGTHGALSSSGQLASNTTAAGDYPTQRTIVEDGTNAQHFAITGGVALADATNYVFSAYVKRGVGSRNAAIGVTRGGINFALIVVDLSTLAITPTVAGTCSIVRSSARLFPNGWIFAQFTFSSTAWGGSPTSTYSLAQGTNLNYTGDGASSILISGYQCELGDSATPPLAWDGSAGVSRAATSNSWAQSLSTTAGTMFAVGMPYSRAGTVAASTAPRSYESITTGVLQYDAAGQTFTAQRTDAIVNARTVTSASTPAVAGSQKIVVQRWDATSNRITVDGVTTSSAAPTTPFAAATPIFIGNRSALDQAYEGWKFLMLFSRALTDAEVALLTSLTTIV